MGINCPMVCQDANVVGNSNNGYRANQGFSVGWNKSSFPFDGEPFLKEIVRDQLSINSEIGKTLLATDKVLEGIDSKMNNFIVAVQD
jgi:hypothetical protein